MKVLSILLVAVFSLFVISCNQQKIEIPEKVLTSFEQMFPTATDIEWEMENENEWEAEFEMDGKKGSACFTVEGEWVETEYEVESLPETIETIVNETYPGYEIDEIEVVESPEFNGYEIEIKNGEEEIEIMITSRGEILEVEMSEIEDEEAEED